MRETRTSPRQDLRPLFDAQSVAIVGISEPARFGGIVFENLRAFGYAGKIFGVNPKYRELYGMPCYPSLRDLPERPDLAILALPNERLLDALCDAAQIKIPAAAIFASAHSEVDENGESLQARLTAVAQANGMVICGPNGMGFHALVNRLVVSGYPITPTRSGNVAFVTHSGSQFDALWQNRRGIRFNYLISAGNEMVTTLADYMEFALEQATTRVIGLFMETVRDPKTFVAALQRAAERDVPIVALKVGRSPRGAELAQTHSGALAGEDAAYDALFKYYGVQRVKSPDETMDTLELFARGFRTPTRYLASVHDSGGERGLLVDLAAEHGVEFAPINAATTTRLTEILEPGLVPVNPVDAWGTGNDYDRIYHDCLCALDDDPATGITVLAVDLYASDNNELGYVHVAEGALPNLKKPFVVMTNLAASADEVQLAQLRALGIPVLMGTENGVRAIRSLIEYSGFQKRRQTADGGMGSGERGARNDKREVRNGMLGESESKKILGEYGIEIPKEEIAITLEEALQAAEWIGYPVALKTAGGVLHKSDRGGVRLGLQSGIQLADAYRELEREFGGRVLLQEMIPQGVELYLGIVNDAQFGAMLAVGFGGIFVEVVKDSCLLMLPTTREDMREALGHLRGAKLLHGVRGQAGVSVDAIVDAAMALGEFANDYGERIVAVDVNPLIALPERAVAVDALVIFKND